MMQGLITEEILFSNAENADISELKHLWLTCFKDVPAAVDMFFDNVFDPESCYTAQLGGKTVSMLFLLPCRLGGKRANYLYAACTAPEYRGRKIMSRLIGFALNNAKERGDSYSVLLPASESLYNYYEKLGYRSGPKIRLVEIDGGPGENKVLPSPTVSDMLLNREKLLQNAAHLEFGENILAHALSINSVYGGRTVSDGNGYAIVSAETDGVRLISEIMTDSMEALIEKIRSECPAKQYILRLPFENNGHNNCRSMDFGMICPLDGTEIPENLYIGLTLE